MKRIKYISCLLTIVLLSACSKNEQIKTITVKNTLPFERSNEVIELNKSLLDIDFIDTSLGIRNLVTGELLVTQMVDIDGNGEIDQILFQPNLPANSELKFGLVDVKENEVPKAEELCYSRFVPERTDDYTWENDKVAFRVYGPTAQQIQQSGKPGGTISSGVDAWLKRVSYPIINKWYKETMIDKTGSYHEDTGEGMDNFHVGVSRGVGGIAVRNNGEFYYSKNYTKWRTITTGPLRTSFYLEYEDWDAGGKTIQESKIISLDLGNNFSKFETFIDGTDEIYSGLTLHEKDGDVFNDNGYITYWQPHADSELGTAIVGAKDFFLRSEKYDVEERDLSNAYANLKVVDNKVVYYAGFAWKESKQYPTKESWITYLNSFTNRINNPLKVLVK